MEGGRGGGAVKKGGGRGGHVSWVVAPKTTKTRERRQKIVVCWCGGSFVCII